jgi:hypothetical protein
MNKLSWRHHYIPEFYLKGFANSDGTFKIFDIEKNAFVKGGKDFSPQSHFFEKNGNTIYTENGADDFIETKFFSPSDNRIAEIFNKINNSPSNSRFGLTEDDMPALQHFVSILFWRLPANYDQISYLIKTKELHELGLLLKSKDTDETVRDEEFENKIKNDPNFFKAVKHYLPYITYGRLLDCRTPLTIQTFPSQLPALCSDNPVIFEESFLPDVYYDDLILPLTHTHVFIRGNKIRKDVLAAIKIDIDLIILKQAKKFVSCTDMRYVGMLNQYYSDNFSSLKELKRKVFETLIEK